MLILNKFLPSSDVKIKIGNSQEDATYLDFDFVIFHPVGPAVDYEAITVSFLNYERHPFIDLKKSEETVSIYIEIEYYGAQIKKDATMRLNAGKFSCIVI